jgi:O-antigen/teichoic acid export membrane protein
MPISRGILQGRKKFTSLGVNMVVESTFKLIVPTILVGVGYGVYGAIGGVIIATVMAFSFSFYALKEIFNAKEEEIKTSNIYNYTKPVFVIIFTILLFYSLDVIIARLIFDEKTSGYYSIASMIAKIIFFGTQPITKAMFPLLSNKTSKLESREIFLQSTFIVSLMILGFITLTFMFPEMLVKIFSGENHVESSSILFVLSLAISLLSVTNLLLLYKISTGKIEGYKYLPIFIIFQVILLVWFSESLIQFSLALLLSSAIFLWGSSRVLK